MPTKFLKYNMLICVLFISVTVRASEDIRVGFMPSMSGVDRQDGIIQLNAAKLAIQQINSAGGISGKLLKLVVVDGGSTAKGAIDAFTHLAEFEKTNVIIGPLKTRQMLALLPMIKTSKIPVLTGAQLPRITEDGDRWVFRVRPELPLAAKAMVKFLKDDRKFQKIAIVTDETAFGIGGADYVTQSAKELGVEVVKRIEVRSGEKSYKKTFEELKRSNIGAVVLYLSTPADNAVAEADWAELKKPFVIMGTPFVQTDETLKVAKGSANDAYAVVDVVFAQSEAGRKFEKDYVSDYKSEPDPIYSYPFDAANIIAVALRTGAKTASEVRDAIFKVQNYDGIMGKISFDHNGNGVYDVTVVQVKNQKSTFVKLMSFAN